MKSSNKEAVITYLIAKWMSKHHPQKEYSLIVKKGINFATKHSNNIDKLVEKYAKFVK